jgi:hypothetical protein
MFESLDVIDWSAFHYPDYCEDSDPEPAVEVPTLIRNLTSADSKLREETVFALQDWIANEFVGTTELTAVALPFLLELVEARPQHGLSDALAVIACVIPRTRDDWAVDIDEHDRARARALVTTLHSLILSGVDSIIDIALSPDDLPDDGPARGGTRDCWQTSLPRVAGRAASSSSCHSRSTSPSSSRAVRVSM